MFNINTKINTHKITASKFDIVVNLITNCNISTNEDYLKDIMLSGNQFKNKNNIKLFFLISLDGNSVLKKNFLYSNKQIFLHILKNLFSVSFFFKNYIFSSVYFILNIKSNSMLKSFIKKNECTIYFVKKSQYFLVTYLNNSKVINTSMKNFLKKNFDYLNASFNEYIDNEEEIISNLKKKKTNLNLCLSVLDYYFFEKNIINVNNTESTIVIKHFDMIFIKDNLATSIFKKYNVSFLLLKTGLPLNKKYWKSIKSVKRKRLKRINLQKRNLFGSFKSY